jgi:hypothetical protein
VKLRAAYPFGRLREMNPLRSRGAGVLAQPEMER